MKRIIIKNLKPDDQIFVYDPIELRWVKCRVNSIENYTAVIEYIEGILKGYKWTETLEDLRNPNLYRLV